MKSASTGTQTFRPTHDPEPVLLRQEVLQRHLAKPNFASQSLIHGTTT